MPFGPSNGSSVNYLAGKIGVELMSSEGFGFTVEGAAHRLFYGTRFTGDLGHFAIGASYELFGGDYRPYAGLKAVVAKTSMKNDSYIAGVIFEPGVRIFLGEYTAAIISTEVIALANSLVVVNLNAGIEIYTFRDKDWGWKYNNKEYRDDNSAAESAEGNESND